MNIIIGKRKSHLKPRLYNIYNQSGNPKTICPTTCERWSNILGDPGASLPTSTDIKCQWRLSYSHTDTDNGHRTVLSYFSSRVLVFYVFESYIRTGWVYQKYYSKYSSIHLFIFRSFGKFELFVPSLFLW